MKLQGSWWRHRKVKLLRARHGELGERAMALWTMALAYSGDELTDGFIDPEWMEVEWPDAAPLLAALLDVKLLRVFGDGWQINDYEQYQRLREQVETAAQQRKNAAKSRWAKQKR